MSPVFDCTSAPGRAEGVAKAATGVRAGALVVLPTDTLYGVGADAFTPAAVQALLAAKGRGQDMPPPVLVASPETVDGLATDDAHGPQGPCPVLGLGRGVGTVSEHLGDAAEPADDRQRCGAPVPDAGPQHLPQGGALEVLRTGRTPMKLKNMTPYGLAGSPRITMQ